MTVKQDVVLTSSGNASASAHIGWRCADLQMGTTSPGGFASVTLTLQQPITSEFLAQFDTVSVYDRTSGEFLNGGRLIEPGKSVGDSGEVWQVTAIGEGPAHMQDQTLPLIYIDRQLENWVRSPGGSASGVAGSTTDPAAASNDDNEVLIAQFPGGSTVANGSRASNVYRPLADAGQTLGAFAYSWDTGKTDANWSVEAVTGTSAAPLTTTVSAPTANTAGGTVTAWLTTDFSTTHNILTLRFRRNGGGATTIADDTTYAVFDDLRVLAARYSKSGALLDTAGMTSSSRVLASQVVEDLLGRVLTRFDGVNATVTATAKNIDQLAYPDGITPGQILDELLAIESAYTWHAWEPTDTGLYEFEFIAKPTTARYEASVVDGFDSPAPSTDLYNVVNVRWKGKGGRVRWTQRTQTIASLAYTRAAMIDLGDEVSSSANAAAAGDAFLAEHASPPNAGTLTIARPIMDLTFGRMVKPERLRAGDLIRVRGVRPYTDSLNATDRDGVAVFRIVSTNYTESSNSTTLELDSYSNSDAREIARLATRRLRKR